MEKYFPNNIKKGSISFVVLKANPSGSQTLNLAIYKLEFSEDFENNRYKSSHGGWYEMVPFYKVYYKATTEKILEKSYEHYNNGEYKLAIDTLYSFCIEYDINFDHVDYEKILDIGQFVKIHITRHIDFHNIIRAIESNTTYVKHTSF
ncbi:hypothetical protein AAIP53_001947 [Flavobacterium psychrophilum]